MFGASSRCVLPANAVDRMADDASLAREGDPSSGGIHARHNEARTDHVLTHNP
jgi:hypothetical protein